ncbi:TPA: YegP family protein [Vibrio alginolyticus]
MARFELKRSDKDIEQPYYFVLIANNGEVIATSEMYTSENAARIGIASVKANAEKAEIVVAYPKRPKTVEAYLNTIAKKL